MMLSVRGSHSCSSSCSSSSSSSSSSNSNSSNGCTRGGGDGQKVNEVVMVVMGTDEQGGRRAYKRAKTRLLGQHIHQLCVAGVGDV
jgi:hypothetical protein